MSGDAILVHGHVTEEHRGGLYSVDVAFGPVTKRVLAKVSGRLHVHRIRLVPGDLVEVELSAYDTTRGRIVYRGRRMPREGAA